MPLALLWVGLVGAAPDASPFGWFMRKHSLSPRGAGLCRMETPVPPNPGPQNRDCGLSSPGC